MADSGRRPDLRVNQLGYLPTGPKCVVWRSDAVGPEAFWVRDRGGRAVFGGWTVPWRQRPEPSSGLTVHVLDFSTMQSEGVGFVVEVGSARSHAFAVAADLYRPLVRDALTFFVFMAAFLAR
jgi:endoglucanase